MLETLLSGSAQYSRGFCPLNPKGQRGPFSLESLIAQQLTLRSILLTLRECGPKLATVHQVPHEAASGAVAGRRRDVGARGVRGGGGGRQPALPLPHPAPVRLSAAGGVFQVLYVPLHSPARVGRDGFSVRKAVVVFGTHKALVGGALPSPSSQVNQQPCFAL
jgi:hypothetical protein